MDYRDGVIEHHATGPLRDTQWIIGETRMFPVSQLNADKQLAVNCYASTNNTWRRHYVVRPSVNTFFSHDAISLYLVDGFQ